ncbi:MAG: hypothetical protein GF393_08660 [Armatimonadia bacterium]|nr:hypothetical protein [Armatimonadia bacterium]
MDTAHTHEQIISVLDDEREYMLFMTGEDQLTGSFRIDHSLGSEIKHNHYLFDAYHTAEIYPIGPSDDPEQRKAAIGAILHRIEHAIKEHYYRTAGDKGIKCRSFLLTRISDEGEYLRGEVDGEAVSRDLKTLIGASRTLTLIEKDSRADRSFRSALGSQGRVRLHPGEIHMSEMSPEEQERYLIGEAETEGNFEDSEDNYVEHHPE